MHGQNLPGGCITTNFIAVVYSRSVGDSRELFGNPEDQPKDGEVFGLSAEDLLSTYGVGFEILFGKEIS